MSKKHLLLLLGILFFTGCQKISNPLVEEKKQGTTQLPTQTITQTAMERTLSVVDMGANSTITPPISGAIYETAYITSTTSWTTWTPEFSYPISTSMIHIEEILKTNDGCQLPCWWGIEPGKTSLDNLIQNLSPYSGYLAVKNENTLGNAIIEMVFPVPEEISPIPLTHRYRVEQNIITELEVMTGNIEAYHFMNLLRSLGEPKELWVDGYIDPSSNNPFGIYLYYPDKGILAVFGVNGVLLENTIKLCPGNQQSTLLVLWDSNDQKEFVDFTGDTHNLSFLQKEENLRQLFVGIDYDFGKLETQECFETPKELWPGR
jgi:hypothetical protein